MPAEKLCEFVSLCRDSLGDAGTIFRVSGHDQTLRALLESENPGMLQAHVFSTFG